MSSVPLLDLALASGPMDGGSAKPTDHRSTARGPAEGEERKNRSRP